MLLIFFILISTAIYSQSYLGTITKQVNFREGSSSDDNIISSLKPKTQIFIVSLETDKPASQAGLQQGDVLLSANLKELKSNEELSQIIKNDADKKGAVMFKVMRRGQTFFIAVPLKNK